MIKITKKHRRENKNFNSKQFSAMILIFMMFCIAQICLISADWNSSLEVGLQGYWNFDDTTGNALDSMETNDGRISAANVVRGVGGIQNNSFDFTPIGYVNISTSLDSYNMSTWTISAWLYADDITTESYPLDHRGIGENDASRPWSIQTTGGTVRIGLTRQSDSAEKTVNFAKFTQTGQWYHVVFQYDSASGVITTFTNGTSDSTDTYAGGGTLKNQGVIDWFIGSKTNSANGFNGKIDEVAIWNRTLGAEEVTQLYNSGVGITFENVDLNSPESNVLIPTNISRYFNCSYSNPSQSILNITLLINGIDNITSYNTTGLQTSIEFYDSILFKVPYIDYNWSCRVGTTTKTINSGLRYFNTSVYSINEETYSATTTEGDTKTFTLNLSIDPNYQISTSNIIYNNTEYSSTFTKSGDTYYLSKDIESPIISTDVNKSFYWNVLLNDGTEINTTTNNQTVFNINIDSCSSYSTVLLNFSLVDEESQVKLNGTGNNATINVDINIYGEGSSTPLIEYSNNYTQKSTAEICIDNSLVGSNYKMNVKVQYGAENYRTEQYNIQNYDLTQSSLYRNITLYDIVTANSERFTINFKDSSFLPVNGAIIDISREYVSEGQFKSIEIPLTDSNGRAVASLSPGDTTYTFQVSKNGELLASFTNVVAICQDILTGECIINLNALSTVVTPEDYTKTDNIRYTMVYDQDTRTITVQFTTIDGTVSTMLLNATVFDRFYNQTACYDSLTSSSGALTCAIPESFTNQTIIASIYKDGVLINAASFSLMPDPLDFFGYDAYLFVIIIIMTLPLMFITSTVGMIIGAILGMIFVGILLFVSNGGMLGLAVSGVWLIVAAAIIIYKITSGGNST